MNQIVACPEPGCDVAAEIVSRWVWPSTDGPVEHVKVFCLHGHARTLLTAWLVAPARSSCRAIRCWSSRPPRTSPTTSASWPARGSCSWR